MCLSVEWIDSRKRWDEFRDIWDGMVERSACPSIFSTWDFLQVSWEQFASPLGNRLAIMAVYEKGRPIAFAPLRLSEGRRCGLTVRRLSHLADWESDRVPFIFPPGREEDCSLALLDFLVENPREWDYLELRETASDGPFLHAVRKWIVGKKDILLVDEEDSPSPYIKIDGDWDDYLSSLGSRTRKNVKRYLNRLNKRGPYELEVFDEPTRSEQGLSRYLELESSSWKPDDRQGIGKNERNIAFYRALIPALSSKGRASVSLLTQGEETLAGLIELRLGETAYASQTTFNDIYAEYSPGAVIQALCLQRHIRRGIKDYELFARFLQDKMRWTRDVRGNRHLFILQLRYLKHRLFFARRWIRSVLGKGS